MKQLRSVLMTLAAVALLAFAAAPALADHDKGKGAGHQGTQAKDASDKKSDGEGTNGSTAGTNGAKAESSETGTKPFDDNPNDHPSGNDKTEEPGGSGTQGSSTSDPDGDANGGADKPASLLEEGQTQGGFDSDWDGNNGCGNDDDFEDDNNGWCGKNKPEDTTVAAQAVELEDAPEVEGDVEVTQEAAAPVVFDQVLGSRIERPARPVVRDAGVQAAAPTVLDRVLGAALPFTGVSMLPLAAIGVALMVVGALALRPALRARRIER